MAENPRPAFASPLARGLLLAGVATYLCTSVHAPEFYESLTIGHYIRTQGSAPTEFHWASAVEGKPWYDTSWLFHLLLSLVESVFGSQAFIYLKMLLLIAFFCVLGVVCTTRAGKPATGVLFALMSGCGVMISTTLGAHLLGWTLLVISIELAYRLREFPADLGAAKFKLLGIFLFSALFANVHASAVLGFLAVAFLGRSATPQTVKKTYYLGVLAYFLGQLSTPYGGGQILGSMQVFAHFLTFELGFQLSPANVFQYQTAFLLLFWVLLGLFLYQAKGRVAFEPSEWAAVVGTTILALGSREATPYALLFLGVLLSALRGRAEGEAFGNLGQGIEELGTSLKKLPHVGVLWFLCCVLVVNTMNLRQVPFTKRLLPSQEIDFLLEQDAEGHLMHDRFSAPYLVYRFADSFGFPRKKVHLTPRVAFLNPEAALAEERLENLAPGWLDDLTSRAPDTVLYRAGTPLYYALSADPDWKIVFQYGKRTGDSPDAALAKESKQFGWAVLRRAQAGSALRSPAVAE